jgi:hypothetical protein
MSLPIPQFPALLAQEIGTENGEGQPGIGCDVEEKKPVGWIGWRAWWFKLADDPTAGVTAALVLLTAIYVVIIGKQTGAIKTSADAAKTAAETAVKQFDVGHRPWIPPDVQIDGEIIAKLDGMRVPLKIVVRNTGSSPAFNVTAECELSLDCLEADTCAQRQAVFADGLLAKIQWRKDRGVRGVTLFPNEQVEIGEILTASEDAVRAAMEADPANPFVIPVVYGAIAYESIAGGSYETGFVLPITQKSPQFRAGQVPGAIFGVLPGTENIPPLSLALVKHPGASGRTT